MSRFAPPEWKLTSHEQGIFEAGYVRGGEEALQDMDLLVRQLRKVRIHREDGTLAHVDGCPGNLRVPVDLCSCGGRLIQWRPKRETAESATSAAAVDPVLPSVTEGPRA